MSKNWWNFELFWKELSQNSRALHKDLELTAKGFGTPLYIYNLERVSENYRRVKTALTKFSENRIEIKVYYAMKANGAFEILEKLLQEDAYIDASAIGEVKRALEVGYPPERIIFTGTNFGLEGFEYLAKSGVLINVDSFSQLRRLRKYAPLKISIRLNPNIAGVGFNEKFDMSGSGPKASRLGIFKDRIFEAFEVAREYGLEPICLHQHVGSNWFSKYSFQHYMTSVYEAICIVKELEIKGFNIQILNLGGGLGVKSHDMYPEFPLEHFAHEITKAVLSSSINIEYLAIEPGRYIVGDAGVLLSTVNMVERKNETDYIGIDIGFNAFHHKFLYGIENSIINLSKIDEYKSKKYAVVGYLGEQGDIFSEQEKLPLTDEEDIIMLYPAGAYCASELANHHLLPTPKELFLEKQEPDDLSLGQYCKACPRHCCYIGPVNTSEEEYVNIVEATSNKEAFAIDVKTGVIQINNEVGEPCHFLNNDGKTCSIHDIKPAECRAYPLLMGKEGNVKESYLAINCPVSASLSQSFINQAQIELEKVPEKERRSYNIINKKLGHH